MGGLMKRKCNYYYDNLNYTNIHKSYKNVRKTCKNKQKLNNYLINESLNLFGILDGLYNKNYNFYNYNIFLIKEPKYRIVMSEEISDKVVSYFISEHLLRPYIEPSLLYSNVATRKNKGSSLAYNLFEKYVKRIGLSKEIYVLRLDISKYFYNIDHKILINKIKRKIKDKDVIDLITKLIKRTDSKYVNKKINYIKESEAKHIKKKNIKESEKKKRIEEISKIPTYDAGKGLSIGNITSQLLAVFYLNDIDHYIKENLKHKHYIRYMDDLIILSSDKEKLTKDFVKISSKIKEEKLSINPKSKIHVLNKGFTFLGYTYNIKDNRLIKRVKNINKRKIRKKLSYLKCNDYNKYFLSLISYKGYIKGIYNLDKEYEFLCNVYSDYYIYFINKDVLKRNNNKKFKELSNKDRYIILRDNKVLINNVFDTDIN